MRPLSVPDSILPAVIVDWQNRIRHKHRAFLHWPTEGRLINTWWEKTVPQKTYHSCRHGKLLIGRHGKRLSNLSAVACRGITKCDCCPGFLHRNIVTKQGRIRRSPDAQDSTIHVHY